MKKKILVVDDNRMMLSFMTNLLEKEGNEVVTAEDGISALDLVTTFTPDVMFIDLILPRISGDLLCRIIRKMNHMKDCYLAILSGALAEVGSDLDSIGADACIAKGPFNLMSKNILATLQQADKPKQDRPSAQILGLESVHPRQMTRELVFRKRHLEAMLESISEGLLEISSGRIVYANVAAVDIVGIPLEELLNSTPLKVFAGAAQKEIDALLSSQIENVREIGLRNPLELNNRLVTIKLLPIKDIPTSCIIVIRDITRRTQMQIELQHARKMEAIGTIASGVAHNFRNTLAGILANSQIIQIDYKNDEKIIEVVDRICSAVRRGEQLVNRLLEFSYKEIKRVFQPIDLAFLIQSTTQLLQVSLDKRITIKIHVSEKLFVMGDVSGLSAVLLNLYNNARHAMPEGGTLTIKAKRQDRNAVVTIADTGHGMDAKTLEKCFDPFFTTREIGKGTGLGLSTTYGIIKNHNGRIRVKSRPNEGTVFKIVLPLTTPLDVKPDTTTPENHLFAGSADIANKKVLVVDDEPSILKALTQLIETLGYQSAAAANADDAVEIYKTWQPDITLLDLGMPGTDGISFAKQIIRDDPGASIVIISGYDLNEKFGIHESDKKLFKGYLSKPIDLNDLRRTLSRIVDDGSESKNPA